MDMLGSCVPTRACSASLRPFLRYIFGAAFDAPLGAAAIGGADGGNGSPLRRETIQAAEAGMCWVPGLLYVRWAIMFMLFGVQIYLTIVSKHS
jgi:hypothetical protein